ncbi:MAG: DEAD/DEAH box helicase [Candidatus Pacearchaeota archaeon]
MFQEILKKIKPRKYQEDIYNTCVEKNCLIILPTGIGKTLIALMLTIQRQKKYPKTKVLFLAPTRPLAEQHLKYFTKHLPELFAEMTLFTGKTIAKKRKELWEKSDIIFSTPQCIQNDLKNNLYTLEDVSLLIEDECHRCLKNYAYTYIAEKYKEQAKNLRIIGMTASPGTDKKTIEQIAKSLNIEAIELRTRESPDVKEYLQELEFSVVKLELTEDIKKVVEIIKKIFEKKIEELKNRKLLFQPPTKINLLKLQSSLIEQASLGNKHFNILSGASACSQAIKISHLIELIETQTLHSSLCYIKDLYEQANKNKSKAVKQLTKNQEFNKAYIILNELVSKNIEHPKINELIKIIEKDILENPKNKSIIFTQYRETALKITNEIKKIPNIKASIFIGQSKKRKTGLSQKEQQKIIEDFKNGIINVIVATSIGEEGLDIPEVNSVIFYEPIPSAIRRIQRAGRTARLMKGKLIILMTIDTLDQAYYYASIGKERKMHRAIHSIKQELENKIKIDENNYEKYSEEKKIEEEDLIKEKNNKQKKLFDIFKK